VLVGYSFGGSITYLFAADYPQNVRGLVLIDGEHADNLTRWGYEVGGINIHESASQLRAAGQLPATSLVVVTRGLPAGPQVGTFAEWQAWQADLVTRSSQGRQVIAEQSTHFDILEQDRALIIRIVREVVEQARR
jgi:pimeloyl-ACP methyl ester carboxylesterase